MHWLSNGKKKNPTFQFADVVLLGLFLSLDFVIFTAANKAICFLVHIHNYKTKDLSWASLNHHGSHLLRPGFLIIPQLE